MVIDKIGKYIEENRIDIAEAARAANMTAAEMEDALAGRRPMPLEAFASFCNYYMVPISMFLQEE